MANNYYRHINPQQNGNGNTTPNPGYIPPTTGATGPRTTSPTGTNPPTGVVQPTGSVPPAGIITPTGSTPPPGVVQPTGSVPPAGIITPTGSTPPPGIVQPTGVVPPVGITPPIGIVPPIGTIPPAPPTYPINTIQTVLRNCMNGLVYVWLRNNDNFWMFPTTVQNNRVYGYRWNQQAGWFPYEIPLPSILSITCVQRY